MTEDKRPSPPFGTKVERFMGTGYHPKLEVRSGTYKFPKLFPGCYDWHISRRKATTVPSWKRQAETAEFSRRLGYRCDHIIEQAKWMQSINGPGWQDLPPNLSLRNISYSKAPRFPSDKLKAYAVPGPGTYGKNHVPYTRIEEKSRAKGFSFSTLSSFERSGCASRSLTLHRPYHLPPNLYNIKTATDEFISKRVSKRGPYDLFSGERFPDPLPDKLTPLPVWVNPSDWSHPKNDFKGKFQRCGKDCQMTSRLVFMDLALAPKNPLDPGPSDYNPYPQLSPTPTCFPFNSSVTNARPVSKCGLVPPPGRYNVEMKRKIKGDGMKSAFISRTKRGLPLPEKLSWFE